MVSLLLVPPRLAGTLIERDGAKALINLLVLLMEGAFRSMEKKKARV